MQLTISKFTSFHGKTCRRAVPRAAPAPAPRAARLIARADPSRGGDMSDPASSASRKMSDPQVRLRTMSTRSHAALALACRAAQPPP